MAQFWDTLSERERLLILIAAGLAGAFLLIQLIAAPLFGWRADQTRALERARGDYQLVEQAASQGASLSANALPSDGNIREAITSSARRHNITLVYLRYQDNGGIDVQAGQAEPKQLFQWIEDLARNHGVQVVSADIAREQSQPGQLRAQLSFMGGGAP